MRSLSSHSLALWSFCFSVGVSMSVQAFSIVDPLHSTQHRFSIPNKINKSFLLESKTSSEGEVVLNSLIDMDVVIYSNKDDESETKLLGALQEDGSLAPLSAWTTEPAFGKSIEFLVDEEDRFSLDTKEVRLHYLLQESELSYGSRQCHRGLGNPHGEESELLYYVEQSIIDKFDVKVPLKPDLEILW